MDCATFLAAGRAADIEQLRLLSRADDQEKLRLLRGIESAMGCLDPVFGSPDERLAWHRLLDAVDGREPRATMAVAPPPATEGERP